MPRPKIIKKITINPKYTSFTTVDKDSQTNNLIDLTVEEFETIRLIDYQNLSQCECADIMQISRPSVGILYNQARLKIAKYLIDGGDLHIKGGNYEIIDQQNDLQFRHHRHRNQFKRNN